jgi:ribonuclease III
MEPFVDRRAMSPRPKAVPQPDPGDLGQSAAGGVPARPSNARRRAAAASGLEARIGYRFQDPALIDRALTHVSALKGPRNPAGSYQRLEFLGDHVLGLAVSEMLFRAFPRANEGELSRRLADLVRKDACADVARSFDLGAAIKLGSAEIQGGGRLRATILADACEALIGAVFLDGGYAAAAAFVERFWRDRMIAPVRPLRDAKTMLQEWAQGRGLPTPAYREVERKGPDHSPEFRITVELPGHTAAEGVGRSKRAAEQAAAAAMLSQEGVKADRRDG